MERQENYLLAYNSRTVIRKLLSFEDPLYRPDIKSQVPYSPTDLLDPEEDEWFYIENFRGSPYNKSLAKVGGIDLDVEGLFSRLPVLTQIPAEDYARIKWLITKQEEFYYFQKLPKAHRIEHKTYLVFIKGSLNIRTVDHSLEIREEQPDVIYCASKDRLLFKSFSRAKDIYPELINMYREATEDDIKCFIANRSSEIVCNPSFDIGVRNRRNVTRLMERINRLSAEAQTRLSTYIRDHVEQAGLNIAEDGKIHISTDSEFKAYLDLLEERFITSDIYSEDRRITAFRAV